jgi:hypothetical protein
MSVRFKAEAHAVNLDRVTNPARCKPARAREIKRERDKRFWISDFDLRQQLSRRNRKSEISN